MRSISTPSNLVWLLLGCSLGFLATSSSSVLAALAPQAAKPEKSLTQIRKRVLALEQELIDGAQASHQAQSTIKKIQALLKLQKEERALGLKRQEELRRTVDELASRKVLLDSRIHEQRALIRKSLAAVERSDHTELLQTLAQERWEAPRRKLLAALVERGVKEIEALRIDLEDANQLELRIADEKQQLAYMLQDLEEQKGVLELNQQLQVDILKKHHQERVARLQNYQRLKVAEGQIEDLIKNFNARIELEKATETEKQASKSFLGQKQKNVDLDSFARLKGHLGLPVAGGKILTRFGRAYDSRSGLYVFKKGVEIETDKNQAVTAVSGGKVAFSGELPDYGKVIIIDHGEHFYSLCAHLGKNLKRTGDVITAGESLGLTDDLRTPVYFEIRSRNVAVNPLQWVSN